MTDEILFSREGRVGLVTLNRPQALNALNRAMCVALHRQLMDWAVDDDVEAVVVEGAGDRAFCAGGDVVGLHRDGQAGSPDWEGFFHDEYRMNQAIAHYAKPYVALVDGISMGGGVGISVHAPYRVATERTLFAMPETGIGLIPDVGGSWLLAQAPGRVGEYLALTSARMGAGDALYAGFADYYLPEAEWPALIDHLADSGEISTVAGQAAPIAPLADLDLSAFAGADMAEIIARLAEQGNEAMLKPIRRNSPLSMAAGLRLVREARGDARMQDSLAREYRFTSRATRASDFLEGVRAQIIDKDRKPEWRADASPAHVAFMLASLGKNEITWEDE